MPNSTGWWRTSARLTRLQVVVGIVLLGVISGAAGAGIVAVAKPTSTSSGCDTVQVAAQALPAVVTVLVTSSGGGGSGSGAVIRADGLILTNDHVIAAAVPRGTVDVQLDNGEQVRASIVGTDPVTDLAVLKIDRTSLPTLTISPREVLRVGQPVVALGAPLGLSGTVTSGIVSALNRNLPIPKASGGTTIITGAIQTDASINPGNSGGPLVTCGGLLIGVNTAISTVPNSDGTDSSGSVGIGFAVPAATAQRIVDELVATGRATHPWIGASTTEISDATAGRFGTTSGLFVQDVTTGGPAATAGLRAGDIITSVQGSPASSIGLAWVLVNAKVGDQLAVQYVRDGSVHEATITLTEQP